MFVIVVALIVFSQGMSGAFTDDKKELFTGVFNTRILKEMQSCALYLQPPRQPQRPVQTNDPAGAQQSQPPLPAPVLPVLQPPVLLWGFQSFM